MDGCHNPIVCATPADITFERRPDLLVGRGRIFAQQGDARQNHPRRAIAALHGIAINKALLNRMEAAAIRQAFDRGDLMPFGFPAGKLAGVPRRTVQEHRAGAALTLAATILRTGQIQLVA